MQCCSLDGLECFESHTETGQCYSEMTHQNSTAVARDSDGKPTGLTFEEAVRVCAADPLASRAEGKIFWEQMAF